MVLREAHPEDAGTQARRKVLRRLLSAGADELGGGNTAAVRAARVLRVAYLTPAPTQRAAAAAVHMSYSSFRRHLGQARALLADELWRRENARR